MTITTRLFGKSGPLVTQVGLGGEGVLRTYEPSLEAKAVIEQAAAKGITYFDSAQAYGQRPRATAGSRASPGHSFARIVKLENASNLFMRPLCLRAFVVWSVVARYNYQLDLPIGSQLL